MNNACVLSFLLQKLDCVLGDCMKAGCPSCLLFVSRMRGFLRGREAQARTAPSHEGKNYRLSKARKYSSTVLTELHTNKLQTIPVIKKNSFIATFRQRYHSEYGINLDYILTQVPKKNTHQKHLLSV